MPIVLKYGAPGPILAAGYASGVGHRQHEQQDDALKIWQQQQYQGFHAQQAALDRQQREFLQTSAFKQQADQAKLGREFQAGQQQGAQDFAAGQATRARGFQAGQAEKEFAFRAGEAGLGREHGLELERRREEFALDARTLEGLRRGEFELPEAAKRRLDQLDAGLVDAMKLGPDQQQEFRDKYETEKRSLLRLAQPRKELSYDERVKQNLGDNYDQYKNLPWQFSAQGEMSLPSGFKMPDAAGDVAKQTAQYQVANTKYTDALQKEAQRLAEENVPEKGQTAKPWTSYVDQAKKNLETIGRTAPQVPGGQNGATPAAPKSYSELVKSGEISQPQPAVTPVGQPTQQPAQPQVTAAAGLAPHQKPLTLGAPHPQTMDEVMRLPPGTVFIWTDGSRRKVPSR